MTQPVDGADQQDRDQTEQALAAGIVALLVGNAAGSAWLGLVQANLSGLLSQYATRAGMDLGSAYGGMTSTELTSVVQSVVDEHMPEVEKTVAKMLAEAAKDHAGGALPMPGSEAEESARVIATSVATFLRELIRTAVAKQLGAVSRSWADMGDSRVREAHREMAGQMRGLDEPFTAPDGEELMYPGDPRTASPELWINCRCWLVYRKSAA